MSGLSEIEKKSDSIHALCAKFAVLSLWVFGSAAGDLWDPETSDFDFAVKFGSAPTGIGAFDQYFHFKQELSDVLGREVDLVELDAVQNPFFQRHLERTRKMVFAA